MIRLASFNLENLFTRPSAMNQENDAAGTAAIEDHAEANAIVDKSVYSDADKARLLELTATYGWHRRDPPRDALVQLQKIRGAIFKDPVDGPVEVVATGRADWVGWFELRREDVAWRATYNTARVIHETAPDILVAVEIESRPTLKRFIDQVLTMSFSRWYEHFMVIDGNDGRGIDLGILSRFPIESMRSHVHERHQADDPLFSRDCPEYDIRLPGGQLLVVIPNHFKSKRNGNDVSSQLKRTAQATRAHAIALEALNRSPWVVVAGDLNDTPDSAPLAPMFSDGFRDIQAHASYPVDRPGTYETGLAAHKLDYLIHSPELFTRLAATGIERRGSYHPRTWDAFDTVESKIDEASDHHLIWADLDIAV
jgi:endonuclease/exonuclease/phosphatase family metal-dependent hydrolase